MIKLSQPRWCDRFNTPCTSPDYCNKFECAQATPGTDPPKVSGYDDDLRRFVDAMKYKLRRNAHKGRWSDVNLNEALHLLKKEVAELEEAIKDGNRIEIELEAADVANFAMIVSAIAIERGK